MIGKGWGLRGFPSFTKREKIINRSNFFTVFPWNATQIQPHPVDGSKILEKTDPHQNHFDEIRSDIVKAFFGQNNLMSDFFIALHVRNCF